MIGVVICRNLFLPVLALLTLVLFVSGCSFGNDNVGAVNDPAAAPASTPQVPESMKTNDFGNGPSGPPQGL
jgi:hypothetical protein